MKAKKTFEVAQLKAKVNYMLANGQGTRVSRLAHCNLLEEVLQETGNYKGYTFLPEAEVTHPGTPDFQVIDDTRRQYI